VETSSASVNNAMLDCCRRGGNLTLRIVIERRQSYICSVRAAGVLAGSGTDRYSLGYLGYLTLPFLILRDI